MAMGIDKTGYFDSYTDLSVHELMLKDRTRTQAYRNFFQENREFIKGKVVLDVGAGTGILSLFAATAGARKVYAVEASDMADLCREIVAENELDHVITIIKGPVEEVALPTEEKVDIIVSEWMGFYLLHESMLDSVICARDRFLSPGGILAPSHASISLAPVCMVDHFNERAEEWSNIYGFDFSPLASEMNKREISEPLIKVLDPSVLCSQGREVVSFDLKTVTVDEVKSVSRCLQFPMERESLVHGFAAWFSTTFSTALSDCSVETPCDDSSRKAVNGINETGDAPKENGDSASHLDSKSSENSDPSSGTLDKMFVKEEGSSCSKKSNQDAQPYTLCSENSDKSCGALDKVLKEDGGSSGSTTKMDAVQNRGAAIVLDTSPLCPPTHWKQTVIFLPQTILVERGIDLCCKFRMTQSQANKRQYNISLELTDEDDMTFDPGASDEEGCGEDGEDGSDAGSDVSSDHAVPCDCGSDRCRLIAALVEKYDAEHDELEGEAELVELNAEVEAARQLDQDIETEGWTVDTSADLSLQGEHGQGTR